MALEQQQKGKAESPEEFQGKWPPNALGQSFMIHAMSRQYIIKRSH